MTASGPRAPFQFQMRGGSLRIERVQVMGVLNLTPDSFYDGGRHPDIDAAVSHALRMADQGAGILDLGGESTRPGAEAIDADEEIRRVVPVLERLAGRNRAWISVDTSKARVAEEALAAGAHLVNDVTALGDPDMAGLCAETGAGVVLVHMQGTPRSMQIEPRYSDVVGEVTRFLRDRAQAAERSGIAAASILLDPGIGFGKTVEHNLALLRNVGKLCEIGYPVLVGTSRKSFIGKTLDRPVDQRLAGTLATVAWCVAAGVSVVRVHDVAETLDVVRMIEAIASGRG